jgi:hypothetical protein
LTRFTFRLEVEEGEALVGFSGGGEIHTEALRTRRGLGKVSCGGLQRRRQRGFARRTRRRLKRGRREWRVVRRKGRGDGTGEGFSQRRDGRNGEAGRRKVKAESGEEMGRGRLRAEDCREVHTEARKTRRGARR